MKTFKSITLLSVMLLLSLTSCSKSLKQKLEGKWKWATIISAQGDNMPMGDNLYFLFKNGKYLYHDASKNGDNENWSGNSSPYKIDEKSKRLTIMTKSGEYESENYKMDFKDDKTLYLTIDDISSTMFGDIWVLKRVD